jgi:hypothetical protein
MKETMWAYNGLTYDNCDKIGYWRGNIDGGPFENFT